MRINIDSIFSFLMGCSNNDENANAEADTGMGILKVTEISEKILMCVESCVWFVRL